MAEDLRQQHASSTGGVLRALRAHRRRHLAQTRRLEELRDHLALVVAERRAVWHEILYGPDVEDADDTEEIDRG